MGCVRLSVMSLLYLEHSRMSNTKHRKSKKTSSKVVPSRADSYTESFNDDITVAQCSSCYAVGYYCEECLAQLNIEGGLPNWFFEKNG
jgi:hypothetical protein